MAKKTQPPAAVSLTAIPAIRTDKDSRPYHNFLKRQRKAFAEAVADKGTILFTVTPSSGVDLHKTFLHHVDNEQARAEHRCDSCRRFVERYGNLVTIDPETLNLRSVMWGNLDGVPGETVESVRAMKKYVESGTISGVFYSADKEWGDAKTGDWQHMAVSPPSHLIYKGLTKSAEQMHAASKEEFRILKSALATFTRAEATTANNIASADKLFRAEKIQGQIEWFKNLHDELYRTTARKRDRFLWLRSAQAPAGFNHIKSNAAGNLLEEVQKGSTLKHIQNIMRDRLDPTKFNRPSTPPGAQNVKRAEEIVTKLGAAGAFRRRFAKLNEIRTVWTPSVLPNTTKPTNNPTSGLFGKVATKQTPPNPRTPRAVHGSTNITWTRFRRTVLPTAVSIEAYIPFQGYFMSFVTASLSKAEPILQWDNHEKRNPFSYYTYTAPTAASQWKLRGQTWKKVNAISLNPAHWNDESAFSHHPQFALFILDGAQDTQQPTGCIFPEMLKSEYHEVRKSIEALSRTLKMEGPTLGSASGLCMNDGHGIRVRVTTTDTITEYHINQFD
jgi:hypothetical protein